MTVLVNSHAYFVIPQISNKCPRCARHVLCVGTVDPTDKNSCPQGCYFSRGEGQTTDVIVNFFFNYYFRERERESAGRGEGQRKRENPKHEGLDPTPLGS